MDTFDFPEWVESEHRELILSLGTLLYHTVEATKRAASGEGGSLATMTKREYNAARRIARLLGYTERESQEWIADYLTK
jgi:hypothetical protein